MMFKKLNMQVLLQSISSSKIINQLINLQKQMTQKQEIKKRDDIYLENYLNKEMSCFNKITKKMDQLRKNPDFQKKEHASKLGVCCLVCNLDICLYEEDVFLYCSNKTCNLMVHSLCVNVSKQERAKGDWYCFSCKYRQKMQLIDNNILSTAQYFYKSKNQKTIKANLISLERCLKMEDLYCVACGRDNGVLFPFENIKGQFIHASCSFWNDSLHLESTKVSVNFKEQDEFLSRFQSYETNEFGFDVDVSKTYQEISLELTDFIQKSEKEYSLNKFKNKLNSVILNKNMKSSKKMIEPLISFKSERLKFNKRSDVKSSDECLCLIAKKPILFIKQNIKRIFNDFLENLSISKVTEKRLSRLPHKSKMQFKRSFKKIQDLLISGILNESTEQSIITKNSYISNCLECNKPEKNRCCICDQTKGFTQTCFEEGCDNRLHAECARRVDCELVYPLLNNSTCDVHALYCHEHSKNDLFRIIENNKIKDAKEKQRFMNNVKKSNQCLNRIVKQHSNINENFHPNNRSYRIQKKISGKANKEQSFNSSQNKLRNLICKPKKIKISKTLILEKEIAKHDYLKCFLSSENKHRSIKKILCSNLSNKLKFKKNQIKKIKQELLTSNFHSEKEEEVLNKVSSVLAIQSPIKTRRKYSSFSKNETDKCKYHKKKFSLHLKGDNSTKPSSEQEKISNIYNSDY